MNIDIHEAPLDMMPVIQNMARFYAYDLSKSCGFYDLFDWSFPENGLYEGPDFSDYWKADHFPMIIKVDNELAGFALIDKKGTTPDVDWNMGQFFIVGKYQGRGIGHAVALQIFQNLPGVWEVMQMPDNLPAIAFWKKVIGDFTNNEFSEERKIFPDPKPHENIVLKFIAS